MTFMEKYGATLELPVVVSPMFLVSGTDLVIASCKAGVVGTFPALNHRSTADLDQALTDVETALATTAAERGKPMPPYGVNLILHGSNPRLADDLAVCVAHKVPLLITSLGINPDLIAQVHGYGGYVFHDVTTLKHARKAAAAGVDGLILVCAGAGGHAGAISPFALLPEVRGFYQGTVLLAGAMSEGKAIAAAEIMGADLAYLGTRFIATQESAAHDPYRQMLVDGTSSDIVYTDAISGVSANFLRASIIERGRDPDNLVKPTDGFKPAVIRNETEARAWKHIWSAGQGIGVINDIPTVQALVDRMKTERGEALAKASALRA